MEAIQGRELGCKPLVYEYLEEKDAKKRQEIKGKYDAESGTRQYGDAVYNIVKPTSACWNDCTYCYVKPLFNRFGIGAGRKPTLEPILDEAKVKKAWSSRALKKAIMFPSSHDIFPSILDAYIEVCKKMIGAGHQVVCVTKPRIECIKKICKECSDEKYKSNILFRFTIGSIDSQTLKHWEPNAPSFEERLRCLKHAFKHGFKTSISIEPMLDDKTADLIEKIRPYVSQDIWIGIMTGMGSESMEDICFEKNKETKTKYLKTLIDKYRLDDQIQLKHNLVQFLWR